MSRHMDNNYKLFLVKEINLLPLYVFIERIILTTLFFSTIVLFFTQTYWFIPLISLSCYFPLRLLTNFLYGKYKQSKYYNPDNTKISIPEDMEEEIDERFEEQYTNTYEFIYLLRTIVNKMDVAWLILYFFVWWWWIVIAIEVSLFLTYVRIDMLYKKSIYKEIISE